MAKIYSISGCTRLFLDFFDNILDIPMHNFSEIKEFYDNYSQIVHQTKKRDEIQLRKQISANIVKTNKALDLYRKMIHTRSNLLETKKKEIEDKLTPFSNTNKTSSQTLKKFVFSSILRKMHLKLQHTFFQLKLWYTKISIFFLIM